MWAIFWMPQTHWKQCTPISLPPLFSPQTQKSHMPWMLSEQKNVTVVCTCCPTAQRVCSSLSRRLQSCAATKGDNETRVCILQSHSLAPRSLFFLLTFSFLNPNLLLLPTGADRQWKRAAFCLCARGTTLTKKRTSSTQKYTLTHTQTYTPTSKSTRLLQLKLFSV